jgi:alkylation response protein AidB-like acyl-CoA dehydrogenase
VERDSHYIFDGTVPWVTGAKEADFIVTGGTLDDGRQVLAAIPTTLKGLTVQTPVNMLALNASQTGPVRLENVSVEPHWLIAGPVPEVMKTGVGGGAGSLTTSALAVGAAAGSLARLAIEAENRPDLEESHRLLSIEQQILSSDMYRQLADCPNSDGDELTTENIRQRANSLVARSAQAYLAAAKGAGFVTGHPAERAVREAMFFLVWSCPQPVLAAALREFACTLDG